MSGVLFFFFERRTAAIVLIVAVLRISEEDVMQRKESSRTRQPNFSICGRFATKTKRTGRSSPAYLPVSREYQGQTCFRYDVFLEFKMRRQEAGRQSTAKLCTKFPTNFIPALVCRFGGLEDHECGSNAFRKDSGRSHSSSWTCF
jgi:hypothetical protein